MGSDGIYYTATNLRTACHKHFPEHRSKTNAGYNKWAKENEVKLKEIQSSKNYQHYLKINSLLIQSAIKNNEVTKRQLKNKCIHFYKNLSS